MTESVVCFKHDRGEHNHNAWRLLFTVEISCIAHIKWFWPKIYFGFLLVARLTSIVLCWSMPRLCMRRRTCSLYSPMPASPSADRGCWCRTGLCTGTYGAIHLCCLIWATERRFDGSSTSILRIRCSQSKRGKKQHITGRQTDVDRSPPNSAHYLRHTYKICNK